MIKGTTPTLLVKLTGRDITEATDWLVTLKSGIRKVVKAKSECTASVEDGSTMIQVPLTQRETLTLKAGTVEIQLNWLNADGSREASTKGTLELEGNLHEGVMA